jgi:hypothetical protein
MGEKKKLNPNLVSAFSGGSHIRKTAFVFVGRHVFSTGVCQVVIARSSFIIAAK